MNGKSRYKVNQILSNLEIEGYVKLVSHRPQEYRVSDDFLESILMLLEVHKGGRDRMIKISNLSKSFGKLEVLKNINLSVDEKEVVVLIGASGSGKSTLLRCLNFLEVAERGDIIIDSENIDLAKTNLIQLNLYSSTFN